MEPFIADLAGAARERTGPQVGGTVNIMDLAGHGRPGWEQIPVSRASDYAACSPSQSANGVGAVGCGQHEVVIAPGEEGTDSDPRPYSHSGLVFHSQMVPLNDQLGWMDYSSHGSWDQSGGLSAHHLAWDPGGLVRPGQTHHGPIAMLAGSPSFLWLRTCTARMAP